MPGVPDPLYVRARRVLLDAADADFSIGPADLTDSPLLAELMTAGGFVPDQHPGAWLSPDGITVDLMVPDALAGAGSRGARLGTHDKTHKISERAGDTSRIRDKDALDVLRIFQATSTSDLARRLKNLRDDPISADVTDEAMAHLGPLFGSIDATGVEMAVRAAGPDADPDTIAASLTLLVAELIDSNQ